MEYWDADPLATGWARQRPFDLDRLAHEPPEKLLEEEQDRISELPEFSGVLATPRLLSQIREHFDNDWLGTLAFVEARNEFRAALVPYFAPEQPDDLLYAAQFYGIPFPEACVSWDDVQNAALKRIHYMDRLNQLLQAV